jgi:hypothetical protein
MIDGDLDETELSDKMQLLSFSHDYHKVLADQHPQSNSQSVDELEWGTVTATPTHLEMPRSTVPPHELELMPEPLAWRKGSHDEYLDDLSAQIPSKVPPMSESRKKHNRTASWTSLRHLNTGSRRPSADGDVLSHSTSDLSVSRRKRIPELGVDKLLGGKRIPNMLSDAKI